VSVDGAAGALLILLPLANRASTPPRNPGDRSTAIVFGRDRSITAARSATTAR
jgi:hypothetical protein